MATFDFVHSIGTLNREQKMRFYIHLAHNLTIGIRAIWSDESIDPIEQVSHLKWMNEVMHRVLNRLSDLHGDHGLWTEADLWQTIQSIVVHDHAVAGEVGGAIQFSYDQLHCNPPSEASFHSQESSNG
jgi:hypothetical protein